MGHGDMLLRSDERDVSARTNRTVVLGLRLAVNVNVTGLNRQRDRKHQRAIEHDGLEQTTVVGGTVHPDAELDATASA